MNISLLIIAIFLVLALYLGIKARKGKDMDMEQFAVGGRGFGTFFIFLLIAGEIYTTFTFLGGSGWAYSKGAAAYYVPAYIFLAYVLSYWLVPKIWRYSKRHSIISQPEYFASKYKSKSMGMIVAVSGKLSPRAVHSHTAQRIRYHCFRSILRSNFTSCCKCDRCCGRNYLCNDFRHSWISVDSHTKRFHDFGGRYLFRDLHSISLLRRHTVNV